jgi:hypothetical protein
MINHSTVVSRLSMSMAATSIVLVLLIISDLKMQAFGPLQPDDTCTPQNGILTVPP